jgi:hypothetical protein
MKSFSNCSSLTGGCVTASDNRGASITSTKGQRTPGIAVSSADQALSGASRRRHARAYASGVMPTAAVKSRMKWLWSK